MNALMLRRTGRAALVAGLLVAPMAVASVQPTETPEASEVAPASELKAVIMKVDGPNARWRANEQAEWKQAEVNDVLSAGAEIDVGLRTEVAIRAGKNATIIVNRMTRLILPVLSEDAEAFRTRAVLVRGKADFKVDRVGLNNDFAVVTPTATLAVGGTGFSLSFGPFAGTEMEGLNSNRVRAIEVDWAASNIQSVLSGGGRLADGQVDQARAALLDSIGAPQSAGVQEVGATEVVADLGFAPDRTALVSQAINTAMQSFAATAGFLAESGTSGPVLPPFGGQGSNPHP
ncbi:MAG: hypothetical protein AB7G17_11090 [Phycisphaerales bacterium]